MTDESTIERCLAAARAALAPQPSAEELLRLALEDLQRAQERLAQVAALLKSR